MRDTTFFEQISQQPVEAAGHRFCTPCFYYDLTRVNAVFLAPLKSVQKMLPSRQFYPLRITPWHSLVILTAFEYRDTDIGPYNEVSISIPVTVGAPVPVLVGALRALKEPAVYILHLPVTTEIAYYGGVEFYGFPKFIAEIEFTRADGWLRCHLAADGQDILTLSTRQITTQPGQRSTMHALTRKGARMLRCEIVSESPQVGISRRADDVRLELGNHPVADDLRTLRLGRMMQLIYEPASQLILSPVLESFPM